MAPAFLMTPSSTDMATVFLKLQLRLFCLEADHSFWPLVTTFSFFVMLKARLFFTKLMMEQLCQPSSTLGALGCIFMATDTVEAGRALKMQKCWASVVTDHCFFIAESKWKMDPPAQSVCKKIMVHITIMRQEQFVRSERFLLFFTWHFSASRGRDEKIPGRAVAYLKLIHLSFQVNASWLGS